jgi:hypothetical protein
LGGCLHWAAFLKMTEVAQTVGLLFSMVKVMYYFFLKTGRATLWPTLSRTHPVTLVQKGDDRELSSAIKAKTTGSIWQQYSLNLNHFFFSLSQVRNAHLNS